DSTDDASAAFSKEVSAALDGKTVLGLVVRAGEIPAQPDSPAIACKVRLSRSGASVQVASTDEAAQNWKLFGKFSLPLATENGKLNVWRFADGLSEGILNRLVRAQVVKGSAAKEKGGKLVYQIRVENFSPLILNGLAVIGVNHDENETPKVL